MDHAIPRITQLAADAALHFLQPRPSLQNLPTDPVILSCSLGAFFTFLLAAACFGRAPEIRLQTPVLFHVFPEQT